MGVVGLVPIMNRDTSMASMIYPSGLPFMSMFRDDRVIIACPAPPSDAHLDRGQGTKIGQAILLFTILI